MKYYTTTYYVTEDGELVDKEKIGEQFVKIKQIDYAKKVTADATSIRKTVLVRRSTQLTLDFGGDTYGGTGNDTQHAIYADKTR